MVCQISLIVLGAWRYHTVPYQSLADYIFWGIVWAIGGPVLVFKYGFWVASDLCIIYVLFKYVCFVIIFISSCFVNIFTTIFFLIFILIMLIVENMGIPSW